MNKVLRIDEEGNHYLGEPLVLVNFYEVQSKDGSIEWGGASAREAVDWFRRSLNSSIYVSVWDESDNEDPRLVTDKIDVTRLVLSVLAWDRQDELPPKPKKEWVSK